MLKHRYLLVYSCSVTHSYILVFYQFCAPILRPSLVCPPSNIQHVIYTILQYIRYGDGRVPPDPSVLLPMPVNASILPTVPPGFGIGHSFFTLVPTISSRSSPPPTATAVAHGCPSLTNPSVAISGAHLFLRLLFPSGHTSPSVYATRGAGHGRICGNVTTAKLAKRVVTNIEEVIRDRGCKWGGIVGVPATAETREFSPWRKASSCWRV